jgi:hypothetical protein
VAGLRLNWPGDGKADLFCGRDNSTEIQSVLGERLAIAKLQPAGQIYLACLSSLLNYTTINLGVAGLGEIGQGMEMQHHFSS